MKHRSDVGRWLVEAKADGSWFRVNTWPSREEAEAEAGDIRNGTWPVEDVRVREVEQAEPQPVRTELSDCCGRAMREMASLEEPLPEGDATETGLEAALVELLAENDAAEILAELAMGKRVHVRTFAEAGITDSHGLLLYIGGEEFQIAITRTPCAGR